MIAFVNWTAPCLSRERSPISPSGEKVADRPDEGAFIDGRVLKRSRAPEFLQER